jgi:hypothetical protein
MRAKAEKTKEQILKKKTQPAPEKRKTSRRRKKESNTEGSSLLFKERLFLQDVVGQKVNLIWEGKEQKAVKVLNVDLNAGVLVIRGLDKEQTFYKKVAFFPLDRAILVL